MGTPGELGDKRINEISSDRIAGCKIESPSAKLFNGVLLRSRNRITEFSSDRGIRYVVLPIMDFFNEILMKSWRRRNRTQARRTAEYRIN